MNLDEAKNELENWQPLEEWERMKRVRALKRCPNCASENYIVLGKEEADGILWRVFDCQDCDFVPYAIPDSDLLDES